MALQNGTSLSDQPLLRQNHGGSESLKAPCSTALLTVLKCPCQRYGPLLFALSLLLSTPILTSLSGLVTQC
jgi:hypothetical protein